MDLSDVAIVVPCYNEAKRLPVSGFAEYLRQPGGAQVLFVDDGSTDNTGDVLDTLCREFPAKAQLLSISPNKGKAEAVRTGINRAFCLPVRYVGFWDADLATPLAAVQDLIAGFDEDARTDIVIGSRIKLLGRLIERWAVRHYVGRVFATAVSLILRLPIYDSQCGAKIFRVTSDTKALFATPFISRWFFDVEILARLIVLRKWSGGTRVEDSVQEIPLREWRDISGSKLRLSDVLLTPVELWRIDRWMHRALVHPPRELVGQSRQTT